MLFRRPHANDTFRRALRAAVTTHRPAALHALLASHGEQIFGSALADFSGRAIADVLSVLSAPDRARVIGHLPRAARQRLREFDGLRALTAVCVQPAEPARTLLLFR